MRIIDADALTDWIKGSMQRTSKVNAILAYIKVMPSIATKEIKYFDDDEKIWKIGRVIVDV